MGMFDTVIFKCPRCGKEVQEQTKVGRCVLAYYEEKEVPVGIAQSLDGDTICCYECNGVFTIKSEYPFPTTVPMKLVEPEVSDDEGYLDS